MKKALLVTTISGFVPQFEMNNVRLLQEMGYEVHYACNYHTPVYTDNNERLDGTGIVRHQIDFVRSPFKLQNFKIYRQLLSLMRKEEFDLIHCHTPMGAVIARLAAHKAKVSPVVYTAHGFHFYKGAPKSNWMFFYPVEKFLAKWTDVLITINEEDYERAKKFKVRKRLVKIPGIGIKTDQFIADLENGKKVFQELGIQTDDFVIISVGELSKRKNQRAVIESMSYLKDHKDIKYIVCGSGAMETEYRKLAAELGVENQVRFAGYRTDVKDLLSLSDIFIFPSLQEGLPVALMEGMCAGLPVICSEIRGNSELVKEGWNGYLIKDGKARTYAKAIQMAYDHRNMLPEMGERSREHVKKYDLLIVSKIMKEVYTEIDNGRE
ncbi:glycosyltransferase [Lachnospiraceae bacterium KM106-2]|nr:glycosyltransferase [Lachnospiraceae bacterium KM106-2]